MSKVRRSSLILFVGSLLMLSCHGTTDTKDCGETSGNYSLEAPHLFNSSNNVSHFAYGLTANFAAVLLYGSNVVPVKRIETGDGMFFQWVSCAAIWVVSMLGDLLLQSPKFYPLAMVGGVIWATGNIAVVPIVKAIGLGLGTLLWGSSSLLMGWASSRFGWFGIDAQDVSRPILNYCGAGLCLLSGLIFFFVKTDVGLHPELESIPLLIDKRNSGSSGHSSVFWIDDIAPKNRRVIGCLLATVVGLLFGSCFVPVLYIKSRSSCPDSIFYGASVYDLDYVYAQNAGIFVTSTVYFSLYCVAMNNKPRVYSRAILPGLLSGLMWALATYCWFLACNYLSSVITYPIVTAAGLLLLIHIGSVWGCIPAAARLYFDLHSATPQTKIGYGAPMAAGYGLVGALWGCLVFREVKGLKNCSIFFLASCVVLTGSLLTAFSKL